MAPKLYGKPAPHVTPWIKPFAPSNTRTMTSSESAISHNILIWIRPLFPAISCAICAWEIPPLIAYSTISRWRFSLILSWKTSGIIEPLKSTSVGLTMEIVPTPPSLAHAPELFPSVPLIPLPPSIKGYTSAPEMLILFNVFIICLLLLFNITIYKKKKSRHFFDS